MVVELCKEHIILAYVNELDFSLSHSASDVLFGTMVLRSIYPSTLPLDIALHEAHPLHSASLSPRGG